MFRNVFFYLFFFLALAIYSQNDLDAIRYSRNGVNGTSRFVAMGGAFGAVGADLTCGAYNPAGLGIYRKGDITYSGSLRTNNNLATINGKQTTNLSSSFAFNNFGIATTWLSKMDKDSRNVLAFSTSQVQNFSNITKMSSYTNQNSIAKDMLNKANQIKNTSNLNSNYEGLAYNTFLLDFDPASSTFFSILDINRSVKQTREIVTSGKVNDVNFSYAYAYKDQFYFGVSIGLPKVEYVSTTTHTEVDDKDSMRIGFQPAGTFTSTFIQPPQTLDPYYSRLNGFKSLTYTEYFKTTGRGYNIKIGGIGRVGESLRIGAYYHSPTFYSLNDVYYNKLTTNWDKDTTITFTDPPNSGYFNYKIITPSKFSINAAYVLKKLAVIGIDYELINYSKASLTSTITGVFDGVNAVIKNQYKLSHNIRIGIEFNLKPIFIRAGYSMQGSPFGNVFGGTLVRQTPSLGIGFKTANNLYFDFVWATTLATENYYLFTTLSNFAKLKYKNTMLAATVGIKF